MSAPEPRPTLLVAHATSAIDPEGRDVVYRTRQPCRALGELERVTVVSGSLLSPAFTESSLLDDADVLVLADAADPDLLPVLDARRRRQRMTIYEVGTHLLSPPPAAPTAARARDLVTRSMPLHLAQRADGVQFATPALERRFGALNARRAVFPSQRWDAPAAPSPRARGRVVVGWAGGAAHAEDLRAIAPTLAAIVERHPDVDVAVMGDVWLREALGGAPTFEGARYLALGDGPTEALLRAGLVERSAGRLGEARRLFTEARRAAPRAYMPELLLGETEEDATLSIEALERAAELNPRSCLAPFLMGLRLGYAGAADRAAAALQRARAIAPSFGAPQERLGELAEAAGHVEEACQLYEEAALQNGAFALPVARLATAALRDGRVDKAVALLERSLDGDPDLWLTNFVLGRSYLELRRFHQARLHLRRALDGAEDRSAVLVDLAKAEVGLGELDAARATLEEARRAVDA